MNDSLASQQKSKKTGGDVLSARLLYLALKCPLLQGKHCQTETLYGQLSRSLPER